jgi:hypothetical protein
MANIWAKPASHAQFIGAAGKWTLIQAAKPPPL